MSRVFHRLATLVAATALSGSLAAVAAGPAQAATSCSLTSSGVTLELQNFTATPGYQLTCVQYLFVYQGDGNVVVYFNGTAVWNTGQYNRPSTLFAVQGDGNVVQYNGSQPIYNAATAGNPNARFVARFSNGVGTVSVVRTDGSTVRTLSIFRA